MSNAANADAYFCSATTSWQRRSNCNLSDQEPKSDYHPSKAWNTKQYGCDGNDYNCAYLYMLCTSCPVDHPR
eukprot:4806393-Amphidinium_carterae.1